ncbi:MAG: DNA-directed RNA polymerase subunit omega [Actinomycetales bacterium]|jgi:DNA-directed RNA polymerase subunit omega|nr:DNA-directed RNA polymerase subunit omega [Actinomycetales bacterium]
MSSEKLEGIVSPSIDRLLSKVDSKYELVIFASKRARQINDYYSALHEGSLFNNVGPLVDATVDEKPLTIALKEIDQDRLEKKAAL